MSTNTIRMTKTQLLRALLERPAGASLGEICTATGWQAHSARAAISGLRKSGVDVTLGEGVEGGERRYRVMPAAAPQPSAPSAGPDPKARRPRTAARVVPAAQTTPAPADARPPADRTANDSAEAAAPVDVAVAGGTKTRRRARARPDVTTTPRADQGREKQGPAGSDGIGDGPALPPASPAPGVTA